ncbi:MAG: DUF1080 domain-containing protein [Thermoguttaceae bacterium]|jgi:hypothetical protein|nr:DUF1080 domain-containing protein [Thermoguttaceae bacterium]
MTDDLGTKMLVVLGVMVILALPAIAWAADGKVVVPHNGTNLDGWQTKGDIENSTWTVGATKLDPDNPAKLIAEPAPAGRGDLVTPTGRGQDIFTVEKFGDCIVELEVMVSKGSNSGIYLMGEYEIQVLDSFGKEQVGPGDMGGIYGATAPAANASKAPGEWQKFVIEFQAPRFNGDEKVANAKFVTITLNGQVIHQNVEMQRQTPGGVSGREHAKGPLMFQGNHGPVAYRNIRITLTE